MKQYPISLEEFEQDCASLSMEALNIRGTIENVRKRLPLFFAKFKSFISSRLATGVMHVDLIDTYKADKILKNIDYLTVRKMRVIVPKGLNTTFLKHLETLHLSQDLVDKLFGETLNPCNLLLARLLSDPDSLRSQRESKAFNAIVLHDFEPVRKRLVSEFSKDGAERRLYGEVIERQTDWSLVISTYNELVTRFSRINLDDVLKSVRQISDQMDRLIENMETDPNVYAASGLTISSLAKLAHSIATEVEHFAMHGFMIEQMGTAIQSTLDVVEKVGKK